jgi:ABC-type nitrate/sulfonate/bicarbonate transport system ATPase subunit
MTGILVLDALSKSFSDGTQQCQALSDISCTIGSGEIVCLMGPSGCGKSTVLRILAGLESADSGTVRGDGCSEQGCLKTAMVFQEHGLFPWLSVFNNIAYGLTLSIRNQDSELVNAKVSALLHLIGMESFRSSLPHQLSGGMKQRVSVARALAIEPEILLMDEPFSALDPFSRRELWDEVLRIRDTLQTTFFIVTHNPEEAVFLADRIVILSPRPAVVKTIVPVDIPHPRDPLNPATVRLIQQVTVQVMGKQ